MEKRPYRGRFAPSPTGALHFGSLVAAVGSYLDARANGGEWIVRIEDVDTTRCHPEFSAAILETLAAFGFEWDGPVVFQSQRTAYYEEAFSYLKRKGLVYGCACSRREIADSAIGIDGAHIYPGTCRNGLPPGRQPRAWRLVVPDREIVFEDAIQGVQRQNLAKDVGDFVLRRADGLFAYQLAVSVDDLEMGITRVVRARDLLDSTPRQIWLIETLGGRAPEYAHAPLLVAPDGRKLSKREGDLNMEALRQKYAPEQLTGKLAKLAGLRPTAAPVTAAELAADFSWDKVPRADIPIPEDF